MGGDNEFHNSMTLPNILKRYNPDIIGASHGTGNVISEGSNFNCAVPGAKADDLPGQAIDLVDRIMSHPDVDLEKDWKMITLFIGGNDICGGCDNLDRYTKENYIGYIREAIDHFHEMLPRTFVNVVGLVNLTSLTVQEGELCGFTLSLLCECVLELVGQEKEDLRQLILGYQDVLRDLARSERYDTHDGFTVVYQPFFEQTSFPVDEHGVVDSSFLAPDCFHLSSVGHAFGAKELWNNMMQLYGEKTNTWEYDNPNLLCPTQERPYISTKQNSPPIDESSLPPPQTTKPMDRTTKKPDDPVGDNGTRSMSNIQSLALVLLAVIFI